jgi:hypothetical protein
VRIKTKRRILARIFTLNDVRVQETSKCKSRRENKELLTLLWTQKKTRKGSRKPFFFFNKKKENAWDSMVVSRFLEVRLGKRGRVLFFKEWDCVGVDRYWFNSIPRHYWVRRHRVICWQTEEMSIYPGVLNERKGYRRKLSTSYIVYTENLIEVQRINIRRQIESSSIIV